MLIPPRLPRWLYFGAGAALFLWLRIEDNATWPAALAGFGVSMLAAVTWLVRTFSRRRLAGRVVWIGAPLWGAGVGLGAALSTALLMLVKNGLHAHLFPDYPFGLILEVLARAPVWMLAGALGGLGLALVWGALRR